MNFLRSAFPTSVLRAASPGLVFVLLFAAIHLPWACGRPLAAPDELRYAEIAREMLAGGDWVVPHLAGHSYLEKPPLGLWLGAIAQATCGRSALALRLPALLATFGTALLLARHLVRSGRSKSRAWSAAAIFSSFAFVHALGSAHVLDPLLAFFFTGAVLAFAEAAERAEARTRRNALLQSGLWLGAAFLTKGFVALVLLAVVILPYGLRSSGGRKALRATIWSFASAALVALPWSLAIEWREPGFWERFLWVEHLERFFQGDKASLHQEPLWYYAPSFLGGSLPWLGLAIAFFLGLRRREARHPAALLAACWVITPLVFLSLSSGKLVPYLLPCFPGLALALATADEDRAAQPARWLRFSLVLSSSAVLVLGLGWIFIELAFDDLPVRMPEPRGASRALWVAGTLASAWILFRSARDADPSRLVRRLPWSFVPIGFAAAIAFPHSSEAWRQPVELFREHRAWLRSSGVLAAEHRLLVSLCWELERTDIVLVARAGELDSGDEVIGTSLAGFEALLPSDASTVVRFVCRESWWKHREHELPAPLEIFRDGHTIFATFGRSAEAFQHLKRS